MVQPQCARTSWKFLKQIPKQTGSVILQTSDVKLYVAICCNQSLCSVKRAAYSAMTSFKNEMGMIYKKHQQITSQVEKMRKVSDTFVLFSPSPQWRRRIISGFWMQICALKKGSEKRRKPVNGRRWERRSGRRLRERRGEETKPWWELYKSKEKFRSKDMKRTWMN